MILRATGSSSHTYTQGNICIGVICYSNFGPLKESEDYFVDSVLPSWEARLTMGLHFIFRVSFQQEVLCSCMHERRGMCPEIMIFLPKSEVWLRDVFGKFLYGVFFFPLT